MMKRIYVVSRYRGDIERNIMTARVLCRAVVGEGHAPFASHLFATQFLDDDVPEQRDLGILAGHQWLEVCHEVWVWTHELPLQSGMIMDVDAALRLGKPVFEWSVAGGRVPWNPDKYTATGEYAK